ncbi:MAG: DNA gyrase subunit A [Parcubacteria group bacterium]|nr:DNA gyrase subunit A [Parcubacteria group bacterium]
MNNPAPQSQPGEKERGIVREMETAYLDYAMSVIVSRALPDVRDGLKPVHRRILYTMHGMGLTHSAKFRKSAAIVGDCLGKYHPHGDNAVYDSLVRMAQSFSLRYPLITGQGNFGSIDGDAAAAQRYTEARMSPIAAEMLRDIERETVDFRPNYDGVFDEPIVLPAAIPQLLLNGSLGIAVGMATNIPPHNLGEVVDATVCLIDHPKTPAEELMRFVQGPDFPTGGIIFNKEDIHHAYATGRGGVVTRGETEIVEQKAGHAQILIHSIPYQVNKAELIIKIADLVHEKKIEGIKDIRDESDKEGLRIAIDLKADAFGQKILNALYKHTDLERVFHFNMIALVDGIQPQVLSLKAMLEFFIKHRNEVVTRRAQFDLRKAEERAHILEGLKKALDHIDAVIKTIKASANKDSAHAALMKTFSLSDQQATAILEMRLQTLAGLERQKIEEELKEKQQLIRDLKALLKDPQKIFGVIRRELLQIKEKYADARKTTVVSTAIKSFKQEDLIPDRETVFMATVGGYVKRVNPEEYRSQHRGGKGIIGMATKEEDVVSALLFARTHDDLLFFTNRGKVYQMKVYDIPEERRTARGKSIMNFVSLAPSEQVTSVLTVPKTTRNKERSLVMLTKNGIIKKVDAKLFTEVRRSGIIAINLKRDDVLGWARLTEPKSDIIITSRDGQAIRFKESDIRSMGRTAAGVSAMRLRKGDRIVGVDVVSADEKSAHVTGPDAEEIIAISRKGQIIRTALAQIPELGRQTQGVRIMNLAAGDAIASLTCL